MRIAVRSKAQSADPRSLGRGRFWFGVSCRRSARRSDTDRAIWHRHVEAHPPWVPGAPKVDGCVYCAAVKQ